MQNTSHTPPIPYTYDQALQSVNAKLSDLMRSATTYREYYFSNKIEICAIINARSGQCGMNCTFCAQSKYNKSNAEQFPMLKPQEIEQRLASLADYPLTRVGLVTSGGALRADDVQNIIDVLWKLPESWQGRICASLGKLQISELNALRKAGLKRYHHNLESSEEHYAKICTTQSFAERVDTVKRAHSAGLSCCCGGIFGLGEGWDDRINFAFTLKEMGIKNIPINFLQAIAGTPLEHMPKLDAHDALRIIAIFRHILPDATLRICGGRFHVLGEMHEQIFAAGANALMSGDYLTTKGQGIEDDCKLISKLGLTITSS